MPNLEPAEKANWSAQLLVGLFNYLFNQYYKADKENDQSIELDIGNTIKQARFFCFGSTSGAKASVAHSLIFYSATVPPGELLHKGAETISGSPGSCYNVLLTM